MALCQTTASWRALFEAWMAGHCWSLEAGWDSELQTYTSQTPKILWSAWLGGCQAAPQFDFGACVADGVLVLAYAIGAGRVVLPLADADRLSFESWIVTKGWSLEDGWDAQQQCYRYTIKRMLWAAWRDSTMLQRLGPFADDPNPVSSYQLTYRT